MDIQPSLVAIGQGNHPLNITTESFFTNFIKLSQAEGPTAGVSDDHDDVGGDVIAAHHLDLVVVGVGHGELPLAHVEEAGGPEHLGLLRHDPRAVLLQPGELVVEVEGAQTGGRLLQGPAFDCQHHLKCKMST